MILNIAIFSIGIIVGVILCAIWFIKKIARGVGKVKSYF